MTKPLALHLPLQGRQWIEASAGTGKTFTLTLLVLRLLLEREIPLPNILAVTFTKAATEELKIKIRAQIKLAQDLLQSDALKHPENLETSKQATASLLFTLLQEKPGKTLRHLLAVAMQDCDRASIFTIHGFCTRVLSDHALAAGQVLQAPELLGNTEALNTRLAYDIWREFGNDRDLMRSLTRLWPTPELLAKQSDSLLNAENLRPVLSDVQPVDFDMQSLHQGLRTAVELNLQSAKAIMSATLQSGILHKSHMTQNIIDTAFDNLENWYSVNAVGSFEEYDFSRLSRSYIVSKVAKANKDSTPTSPLFEAIESWQQGFEQMQIRQEARDIYCLHKVRDKLKQRRDELLQIRQQYSYDDLISQVVRALAGESGAELCQALRKDYPVALVDEFQDTDSQQWKIFSSLYPEHLPAHALYLIGDPKQSIYRFRGGDVHAYLAAKGESDQQWQLPENFRSRPGLLGAIATLFEQGGDYAFREHGICFYPVQAGGAVQENDFILDDQAAPVMSIALLPEYINPDKQKPEVFPAAKARELATRACVEKIHEFLSAGQEQRAKLKDKETKILRELQAKDIAVLVNTNSEATQVQLALSACGIASVVSSLENLFATPEAREVFIILDALIKHQDQARWRGALSTVLLGYHAEQIHALAFDDLAATRSADLAVEYRERWLKQGVLSLLSELCAAAASRILPLADGERRLSNYLQLAETLQQASALALGPEQCLRWLSQAMQEASTDEENMLRLDSDQKRVKIMTLHKSKGLEFPLVFMPFANFGKAHKAGSGLQLLNYHEDHQRITHAMVYADNKGEAAKAIKAAAASEQMAEQVRLLYVGMTRAHYYCWLCCGTVKQANASGLSSLLFRNEKDEIKTPAHDEFLQRLQAIHECNPQVQIEALSDQKRALQVFKPATDYVAITLATPSQHLQTDWRVLSFSQLTHAAHHQGPVVSAAADEAEPATHLVSMGDDQFDKRFAGIAFGNALHHVLENTKVEVWRDHDDINATPTSELPLLQQALLRQGYRQEELTAGIAQLSPLIFNTLKVSLPEGVRLCDLSEKTRLNEMEFHFSLRTCDSQTLLALLKQYDILQQREDFQTLRHLNGLMTGKVDLIYQHQNRFYICDYKSNRLPAYDTETCQQAMRDSEYDFQALIYTLALHRWCKFRLQAHYDYEKHIGGIRYLFCRGLQANAQEDTGIVAMRFDRDLIDKLERLLHPAMEATA